MSNLAIALCFSSAAGLSVADEINAQIDKSPEDMHKTTPERIVKQQLEDVTVGIKEFRDALVKSIKQMHCSFVNSGSACTTGRVRCGPLEEES